MVTISDKYLKSLKVTEFLTRFPGLSIRPNKDGCLYFHGYLAFTAISPSQEQIADNYKIDMYVYLDFPRKLPIVIELNNRIPENYHKNYDKSLCLGSPVQQLLILIKAPDLITFVEKLVIPYLYGYSSFEKTGILPFGELRHGKDGLLDDLTNIFKLDQHIESIEMLRLGSMKKRVANKLECPCGRGRRLGKCHSRILTPLRKQLGTAWFRTNYQRLKDKA